MMIPPDDLWYEECFDAVNQFMGILDGTGRIIRVNRAALEFTGLTHADVTDIPLWLIPWPALIRQNRQELKRAVFQAVAGITSRNELKTRSSNHTEKIIEFSVKPIRDTTGLLKFLFAEGRYSPYR